MPSSLPGAVITDCLQGELEVVTLAGTGKAKDSSQDVTDRVPFLMLGGSGGCRCLGSSLADWLVGGMVG